MDKIIVKGGTPLHGEVSAGGAKNSALILMFSSLLAEGEHIFENVPDLADVKSARSLLETFGCETEFENSVLKIRVRELTTHKADYDVVRKMRASILCLGPILARFGEATVSMPGGCAIGSRPIDLHLDGMRALGAQMELKEGYVHASCPKLQGATYFFEKVTVGGTENMMMAASLAEGVTILENAAKEPEISDLAEYLNKMGAKITGHGTSLIRIEGVKSLKPSRHRVIPDRIEVGTLLIAGAITGGEVLVKNCRPDHLESFTHKMRECGFKIETTKDTMLVKSVPNWQAVDVTTAPHPLFPTDLQAQYMALMTLAQGTCVITETVFENRFMHVNELLRMGADITPKAQVCVVRGSKSIQGAQVMATDLRASASLVLAGLAAKGETTVNRIYHLDRGYEKLEAKLSKLGAQSVRAKESS
ncbi:MAG: UDP-N-acetylglucosamine 1-carboxyvinyltransferase [Bdellovibrionota bacterium]